MGTIDIYRLVLSIDLDRHSEEKLPLTVPDVVWAKDKTFHAGGRVKTKSSRLYPLAWNYLPENGQHCKRWCLDLVPDLQCPVDSA